ncbi:MAG: SDR family oxidoreductase [Cyanobacteria bacterium P01_H01_bin.74]
MSQDIVKAKKPKAKRPVALITGASQGIGAAIALKLAKNYDLALCARNKAKLDALADQLKQQDPLVTAHVSPCDVTDNTQIQETVKHVNDTFGRIDVLINNAGVAPKVGLLQELSADTVNKTIDTNLKAPIFMMQAVIPIMVEQGSGTIININSVAGQTAYPFWAVYDASKFGLRAVTEAVAEEQRNNNIKVMGIYPGAVDTAIWDALDLAAAPDKTGMMTPDDIANAVNYVLQQPAGVAVRSVSLSPLKPTL